jgi:hypothetical protein
MMSSPDQIDVYLEIGEKRTFAGALDWPGWSRSGWDEESALAALADYGPRYAAALRRGGIDFAPPGDPSAFNVVERLEGNATTDFGTPGAFPSADARENEVDDAELARFVDILRACWAALDAAVESAEGHELRKGPRGGGRDLEAMIKHVLSADEAYLSRLGWKYEVDEDADVAERLSVIRGAMLDGLAASVRGELPTEGPRGGVRWSARYYVRRAAWHTLDHAWEIEDRIE